MALMNCKNCGAELPIKNQFVRSVSCEFCGSSYIISGSDDLSEAGKGAKLADYPSRLNVGSSGKIKGRGFRVLGRVRYSYNEGFWEEWQIEWDDGAPPDWLEEDEGMWILYKRKRIKSEEISAYERIRVGSTVKVNQYSVFVTEKRKAKMVGSSGQFSSVLPFKDEFGYFQGGAGDDTVSITYWPGEIELSVGEELDFSDVQLD